MKLDIELEDILYSVKNKNSGDAPQQVTEVTEETKPTELAPPKPKFEEQAQESGGEENLIWIAPEKENKEKKAKKPASDIKANFKAVFIPHLQNSLKKLVKKQTLIALGIAVLVAALAFGGVKLYQYSKVAYLKPYEKLYGIEYPVGIKKEFCDAYGKNSSLAGAVVIEDTETDELVYSEPSGSEGRFERGSSVYESQHYRAIALNKSQADLEKVYATAEGYLNATQKIKFQTLFGEETYKVVAAYYVNTKPEDDNGYVFPYNCYGNFTEKSFAQYQDRIKCRSLYFTGRLLEPEDDCLTVSVDSDIMPDYRFVIVGIKVKGKVEKTTETTVNEAIHYPQSLCDKMGIHNSYHLASHWYPEIYVNAEQTETKQLTIDDFTE